MGLKLFGADKYYLSKGKNPCCAGCDFWITDEYGIVGECNKSALVSAKERHSLLGKNIKGLSIDLSSDAGHILTKRDYKCGNFKDSFNWEEHGL